MSKTHPANTSPEARNDLRTAVHDLFQHDLDRRILLYLYGEGEARFAQLFRISETTSKNHFQRSLNRLQDHILVDRRIEEAGKSFRSRYALTPRGKRFATTIQELAKQVPSTDQGLGQAIRDEILAASAA